MNSFPVAFKSITFKCLTIVLLFSHAIIKGNAIDSLKQLVNKSKSKQEKVDLYNNITFELINDKRLRNVDSIEKYHQNALIIAQNIDYVKGEAKALYLQGKYQLTQNYADKALLYFIRSLTLYQKIKDEPGISACNLQLGVLSYITQNYYDAINYFNNSTDNKEVTRSSFALKNYLCALSYVELDSTRKAHQLFTIALELYKSIHDSVGIMQCNTFMGKLYTKEGNYDKAIQLLEENLEFNKKYLLKHPMYPTKSFLADAYLKKGNSEEAIRYGLEAYKESGDEGFLYYREATKVLYEAYDKKGEVRLAYYFLKRLRSMDDSLRNNITMQKIGEIKSQYIFEQQMLIQKNETDKKAELSNIEKKRIKAIVWGVSIALLIASVLLFVVYKNSKEKQRTNKLLQEQNQLISKEQKRNEELLLNILPEKTALELKLTGKSEPKYYAMVTVLFTDFVNFTKFSETLSPEKLVEEINYCYTQFDAIITTFGIEKIKTIGDSYMCAGGLPNENTSNPIDVVNAALEMRDFMIAERQKRLEQGKEFFELRIGLNTGPVVAGIVGVKKFAYDIWGDTVNIASRIESCSEPGKINISEDTYIHVKDYFNCESRGKIAAKNKGLIEMYFVEKKTNSINL